MDQSLEPRSPVKFYNCQHSSEILRGLNDLRNDAQFHDVILISNDARINAHKNVLAAASRYFMAMFSGRFEDSAKKEIELHNLDSQSLKDIIDYMYSSRIQIGAANVQAMMTTAAFLQVEWIEESCAHYMINILGPANCLGFMYFAEKHSNKILLHAAKFFSMKHFDLVMKTEEFLELSSDELLAFLTNDEIYIHTDNALLVGLSCWVGHNPKERLQHFSNLARHLHPACITEAVISSLDMKEHVSKWHKDVLDSSLRDWNIFVLDKMGRKSDLNKFDLTFRAMTPVKPFPSQAFAVSMVGNKSFLYVQGGCAGRSRRSSYYYNIYRDLWHAMLPMLEPRSHHRSLVVDNILYALGGHSKKNSIDTVECLDLEANTAMYVASMLAHRSSMGAVVLDKCLYVMGGETDHQSLHSTERYDPREGRWQSLASLNVVNSYCTSAVIGNHIYCCQGLGRSMERFDARAGNWEFIDFSDEREFYEIFSVDNSLYSVSGEVMSRYLVETNQWRTVFEFPSSREWDTAVGMQVVNYTK